MADMVRIVEYGIYLNHKRIETQWFDVWEYPSSIRETLINQGYDPTVKVRRLNNFKSVPEWREP